MTTPFDIRTEQLAGEYFPEKLPAFVDPFTGVSRGGPRDTDKVKRELAHEAFTAGRNSARESLMILARAVKEINDQPCDEMFLSMKSWVFAAKREADAAIAKVKSQGNWPLEETP